MKFHQPILILTILLSLVRVTIAEQREALDDNDILEAVESELRLDEIVSADTLNVHVNQGVVTVSGDAFTLLQKRRIEPLLGSLKGVRAIVNRVRVWHTSRTDEQIEEDLLAALRDDSVVDEHQVDIDVASGEVVLKGEVDSFPEKRLAELTVAGIRGVREIDNRISIAVKSDREDDEIKAEIRRRLDWHPMLADGLLDAEVDDGIVTLTGVVGSANEKSLAGVLSWVAGVRQVVNKGLEVQSRLDDERRRDKFTVLRNDVQLKRAVEDALLYDPRIRGAKITVRVRLAAVSLLGNVSSLAAKRAAESDAKNTLGVRRVVNLLKVKAPDWPGDAKVTERVQQALARDVYLAESSIQASSHFGRVFISGEVNTQFVKQRAEAVVANVIGVLEVVNRLTTQGTAQTAPDEEILEDLERRLRWSALLDTKHVTVAVDNGTVTLRGTVDTWHERQAVGDHAYLSGAARVINKLSVRSLRDTPSDLKATVIPKRVDYVINQELSAHKFRQLVDHAKRTRTVAGLPAAPEVDLILKLSNEGSKPARVRVGHDQGGIELSLTGEGAVHVRLDPPFVADFRPGRLVTVMPGKSLEFPIRSLEYGFRDVSERWYWTQPGDYALQATFAWPSDVRGIHMRSVAATPVKLSVRASDGPSE